MEQLFFPVTRREAERSGVQYSSEANKNAGFPSQLRKLRKEKGVSQDIVSKELGISKSTLGLWETGDTLPDAKAVHDLAVYFDVSTDYLLGLSKGTKHEYHDFAKITHFSPITIANLMEISGGAHDDICFMRYRVAFEYLLNSHNFKEIFTLLCEYLDTTISHEKVEDLMKMYVDLDKAVGDISKGNLHIVTSDLLAQTILSKVQQMLIASFNDVKGYVCEDGGWEQYMPK